MTTTTEQMMEQEIAEQKKFEAETVAFEMHDGRPVTMEMARKISEKVFDADDWKNPCAVFVPHYLVEATMKTLEFYHGAPATTGGIQELTGYVLVESSGYAA